jgi:hypothetical protein
VQNRNFRKKEPGDAISLTITCADARAGFAASNMYISPTERERHIPRSGRRQGILRRRK